MFSDRISIPLQFPLERFFPPDEYEKAQETKQSHLQHMMVHGCEYQKLIEAVDKMTLQELNQGDPKHRITPFAAAILSGHYHLAAYLAKKGVNVETQDQCGFTPLFYACVLQDIDSMVLIQEAMKVKEVTIDIFKIFPTWKEILAPQFPSPDEEVFYFKNAQGQVQAGTAAQFFHKYGKQFYKGIVSEFDIKEEDSLPKGMQFLASIAFQMLHPGLNSIATWQGINQEITEAFERYSKQPPCTYTSENPNGVFARQDIPPQEVCFRWSGVMYYHPYADPYLNNQELEVTLKSISSRRVANESSIMTEGFPNVICVPMKREGAISHLFMAIERIEKGEQLIWSSAFDEHKLEVPFSFSGYDRFLDHLKKTSLTKVFKDVLVLFGNTTLMKTIELEKTFRILKYFFHNPGAIIVSVLNNMELLTEFQSLLNNSTFKQCLEFNQFPSLEEILLRINRMLTYMNKIYSNENLEQIERNKNFIIEMLRHYSVRSVLSILTYAQASKLPLSQWIEQEERLKKVVSLLDTLAKAMIVPKRKITIDEQKQWLAELKQMNDREKIVIFTNVNAWMAEAPDELKKSIIPFYVSLSSNSYS